MSEHHRTLRILRVITRLNVGGPTRHVRLLQVGLDRRRFEQILVHGTCEPGEGEGVLDVPGPQVRVAALRRSIHPVRDHAAQAAIEEVARRHRPHLIHTHQAKAGILGRRVAARLGIPAIHTYHGHTFEGYFGTLRGALFRAVEKRAAARTARIVCQSPSQERDVLRYLGSAAEGRTLVIPPALDPAALEVLEEPEDLRRRQGTPAERKVLLLPARLVPVKRPELALDLLLSLTRKVDVELWFAGSGILENDLRNKARCLGLADRVRFTGLVPHPASFYKAADLVLLTSRAEGTPLALLEAMALGVPVAATRVGGVEDLLDGCGELLDPEAGTGEWARVIAEVLHDETLRVSRTREALEMVARRHQPATLLDAVAALYAEVVAAQEREGS